MSTRRLPVFLLLDTSGSMSGEPITAVNTGLGVLVGALRQDPHALESVYLSIITFDVEARVILPLTSLENIQTPEVTAPQSGPTHMGEALELLGKQFAKEIIRTSGDVKGDWAPFLFIMTDGKPSDRALFDEQCSKIRALGFASIIGCVAGPSAREEDLRPVCDHIISLDTMDSQSFTSMFKWVSSAISGGNRSMGATSQVVLPPPPPEIQVVA